MLRLRYLTHYRLLNVEEDASSLQIRLAYRQEVEQAKSCGWKERLIRGINGRTLDNLQAAFEELTDPSRRAKYDEFLKRVRSMQLSLLH